MTGPQPRVVAIDARGYFTGGGVGRYTKNLVRELVASPTRGVELLLLISNRHTSDDLDLDLARDAARTFTVRVSQAEWMNAEEEDRWLEGEVADAALFHSLTGHWLPQDRPSIATLLDMTPILKPRLAGPDARKSGQRIADQLSRASHLLAISHSTARDAQSVPGGRMPPMTVVPLAAAPMFRPGVAAADTLAGLDLQRDGFLLAVSVLSPHKNLVRLIEAYAGSGVDVPLVVAGAHRDDTDRVEMAIRRHALHGRVRLIGRVSDTDLAALYASCRAFVYPSLYEGFGLPVLEAMACGAAVVASRTSSIPEVAGDAALLVDPARTRSLVAALKRIHHDTPLREQLRRLAVVRAASFSWSRTAAATLRIYHGVLEARAA